MAVVAATGWGRLAPVIRACQRQLPSVTDAKAVMPSGKMGLNRTSMTGEQAMAAMKPRTGDGPMEVTKEGRSLIMRVPLEGGGRLVVELKANEAAELKECLEGVTS